MKKIIIIISVAILLLILFGVWSWFGREVNDGPVAGPSDEVTGSPFGTGDNDLPYFDTAFEGEVPNLPSSSDGYQNSALFKISGAPVSGFITLSRKNPVSTSSPQTVVRYVDRATGHIFDTTLPDNGGNLEKVRITNNTIAQVYTAHFRPDGLAVFIQSLDPNTSEVKNMTLTLTPRASSTDGLYGVVLSNLRGTIESPSVGTGADTLVYVSKDSASVVSSKFNGDGLKTLWNGGGWKYWRTGALGNATLLFTKPSVSLPGFAYALSGGTLTKIAGPLNGLSAVANSSGTQVLYSYTESGEPKLSVKNLKSEATYSMSPQTIADKCVWSKQEGNIFFCGVPGDNPSSREPDNWYMGKSHFSDSIWKFDTNLESAQVLSEPPSEFGLTLDISSPSLSPTDKYLVFINKTDLSLWALRLY